MRNKQFTWTSSIAARSSGESLTALRWLIIPQTIANWSVIFSNGSTNFGHDGSTVLSNSSKSLSYKDTVKKQPSQIKKDQTLINPWTETNKDFYIIYNTKQNPEIKTWKKKNNIQGSLGEHESQVEHVYVQQHQKEEIQSLAIKDWIHQRQ